MMNKIIPLIKTISTIIGLLSCLFFSALALFFLSQGYRPGDCVNIPVVGIEIPLCRPTPAQQPTTNSSSPDVNATVMAIAIQQTSVALQQLQPTQPPATALPPAIIVPEIQPTAFIFNTPTPAPLTCKNALRNIQSYSPGQVITGAATLHPFEGCTEMASQLGFVCIGYWGINVKVGQSIVIPESVTLVNGNVLSPPLGTFSTYENDGQMENTQAFWLANCK